MRLEGKVALISGGAHGVKGELMGFGGASAWLFVREGAKVVLGDIAEVDGQRTAAQIRDEGGEAIFVKLDVTSEEDWQAAVQATLSNFGRLDVLVNNAGTGGGQTVEDTTEEIWDGQMNVHAKGVFLGTKHAIPAMRKTGGGSIVNISSIYGLVGSAGSTAYHAAKGAIRIFTKSAAIQHSGDHIRVNSVHPGFATTPMTAASQDQDRRAWITERIPMGRFGSADEIAQGILYLASDESSFVTGSELVIDGGTTAQ
jgi:NAD(P)-dependent dehydrogenase (short-subunit alcohol dehydrogenase family)